MTGLPAAAIERYRREGYLFPLRVIGAAEAADAVARLQAFEADLGHPVDGPLRHKPHLLFTWADRLVRHPAILDAVEPLIGPDILCWESVLFIKEPRTPDYVSWHQDVTYWGLEPADILTAWLALTPSTTASGAMRVIPGSHAGATLAHVDTYARHNMLSRGQEIAVAVDEDRAVDLLLQPGEMSLHDVKMAHASPPNRSDARRIGLAIRYVPAHVRQTAGGRDSATLVRGHDRHHHFEHEPRPARDDDPAQRRLHLELWERRRRILFRGAAQAGG